MPLAPDSPLSRVFRLSVSFRGVIGNARYSMYLAKTRAMEFISTDPSGTSGEKSELKIWEKVKDAFAGREGYAYWRYPLFSEVLGKKGKYKEPDILIVDRELGLIIIEVKGCYLNQIKQINGPRWSMTEDFYDTKIYPVTQANS